MMHCPLRSYANLLSLTFALLFQLPYLHHYYFKACCLSSDPFSLLTFELTYDNELATFLSNVLNCLSSAQYLLQSRARRHSSVGSVTTNGSTCRFEEGIF